jgi:hypothetical protein
MKEVDRSTLTVLKGVKNLLVFPHYQLRNTDPALNLIETAFGHCDM